MEISDAVRAAHRDLSPLASRLLDHALASPEMRRPLDFKGAEVPEWVRGYKCEVQSWPLFIGEEKLQEIARATVGITRLARSIPERFFANDARRITKFYGWDNEAITALLLTPPTGLDTALARCDFISSEDGLKCLEINGSANLGGWELRFLERSCRKHPAIARFLAAAGDPRPIYRDPWHSALSFIVRQTLRAGIADRGELNIALALQIDDLTEEFHWHPSFLEAWQRELSQLYADVLADAAPGLRGEMLCCPQYDAIKLQGGGLMFQGRQVHAVLETTRQEMPRHVFRCFKTGVAGLYNGPLGTLLGDKRNLALLSELAETDLLNAEERALVERHVPWSRQVSEGRTTWRGESVSLLDFARAHRELLVLKPARGRSGTGVCIGSQASPEEWSANLEKAASSQAYLLQEMVRSRQYLFQSGPDGCALHDIVWGTFCFGEEYGGGFLRLMPSDRGPCVINYTRGATEGFMFEV